MPHTLRRGACLIGLSLLAAACSYRPAPTDLVRVWDTSVDLRACRHLRRVSEPVPTHVTFAVRLDAMRAATLAAGGTDLLLRRSGHDNAFVTGLAYRCPANYSGFTLR